MPNQFDLNNMNDSSVLPVRGRQKQGTGVAVHVGESIQVSGRRWRWLPLAAAQTYLWGTVALFAFGPCDWPLTHKWTLYIYLTLLHTAFFVGYAASIGRYSTPQRSYEINNNILNIVLVVNAIWIVPMLLIRLQLGSISILELWSAFSKGLLNPGTVYREFHDVEGMRGSSLFSLLSYANILVAPFVYAALPITCFYWRQLSRMKKAIFLFIILADMSGWVARGTNKGLFDPVLVTPWLLLASRYRFALRFSMRWMVTAGVLASLILLLVITYFSIGMRGRMSASSFESNLQYGVLVNDRNVLVKNLPDSMLEVLIAISTYLNQGYYALGLALEMPFQPCYGVGNSYFFQIILRHFLPTEELAARSYPGRLESEHGIPYFVAWQSFYSWFASDVSFVGVVILVAGIGWLLGTIWQDTVLTGHPYPVILLALIITMIVYFPANNQILGFSITAISFSVYLWRYWSWRSHTPRIRPSRAISSRSIDDASMGEIAIGKEIRP